MARRTRRVTFFWYHAMASRSPEAICVPAGGGELTANEGNRGERSGGKAPVPAGAGLTPRLPLGALPSASPAVCQEMWFLKSKPESVRATFSASVSAAAGGERGERRGVPGAALPPPTPPPPPPRRPALTWCPLLGGRAAGTVLFSGPGRAVRRGAGRRAPQAASSPRGGDAGGAVTMETAEAAFRPAPGRTVCGYRPGVLQARRTGSAE